MKKKNNKPIPVGSLYPNRNVQDKALVYLVSGICPSLRATDYKDPQKVLLCQIKKEN